MIPVSHPPLGKPRLPCNDPSGSGLLAQDVILVQFGKTATVLHPPYAASRDPQSITIWRGHPGKWSVETGQLGLARE